jgi:RNA-splicing ligase RtcB
MKEIRGVRVWGEPDERTLAQALRCAQHPAAVRVCLMADAHVGYAVPIGGVIAYRDAVSPNAVGFDIACGIKAVRTDADLEEVRARLPDILRDISRQVSFGLGRTNPRPVDHPLFDDPTWRDVPQLRTLRAKAQAQLGTVGAGNHFVDLLEDEAGRLWVAVHFGSRGFGFGICAGFLNLAHGRPFDADPPREGMDVPPTVIGTGTELGQAYLAAMRLAGQYAYAGRDYVVDQVLGILGARAVETVHNHHNYCLPGDAQVATPAGTRPLAELEPGDWVYSLDPSCGLVPAQVLAVGCTGLRPLCTLETDDRCLRATEDHRVLTAEVSEGPDRVAAEARLRWKPAGQVRVGDLLVCAERPLSGPAGSRGPGRPGPTAGRGRAAVILLEEPAAAPRAAGGGPDLPGLPPGVRLERVRAVGRGGPAVPVYDVTVAHPDHNFVCDGVVVHNCWVEEHDGERLYVVRKGATPAWPGQAGFVGGSMADLAVVVEGVDTPEAAAALRSTVHGAGRVLSRTAARGRRDRRGRVRSPGMVSREDMERLLRKHGVLLVGGDVDEAPQVYRPLRPVLEAHHDAVRVVHRLRPIGVVMAGPDVRDPYKD